MPALQVVELPVAHWDHPCSHEVQAQAALALESGHVLLMPHLPFALDAAERHAVAEATAQTAKNVSLDPTGHTLQGSGASSEEQHRLHAMMQRYATASLALVTHLIPAYAAGLRRGRTSFRPAEIAGRPTSWRKDDSRLHVDSFPSSPTQGERILRVFTNINPHGQARSWRVGEPFEDVAKRFLPSIRKPLPGEAAALRALRITKSRRSAYDHYMLQLHDRMKADARYQDETPQLAHEFAPDCTWIVYTDQTSHAAMGGRFALEQTCYLDPKYMVDPKRAPLAVLERLLEQPLV